jgi:hypothetical protein
VFRTLLWIAWHATSSSHTPSATDSIPKADEEIKVKVGRLSDGPAVAAIGKVGFGTLWKRLFMSAREPAHQSMRATDSAGASKTATQIAL